MLQPGKLIARLLILEAETAERNAWNVDISGPKCYPISAVVWGKPQYVLLLLWEA